MSRLRSASRVSCRRAGRLRPCLWPPPGCIASLIHVLLSVWSVSNLCMRLQEELPKRKNPGKGGAAAADAAAQSRRRAGIAADAAEGGEAIPAPEEAGDESEASADDSGASGEEGAGDGEDGLPTSRRKRRVAAVARFTVDGVQYQARPRFASVPGAAGRLSFPMS